MAPTLISEASTLITEGVSCRLQIPFRATKYVLNQVAKGATVPFLARYRRDETGNLDEKRIRMIIEEAAASKELERRRSFMLQSLTERQLLTPKIAEEFQTITDIDHLEDAWEPYKVRKTSLASRGREEGLWGEKLLLSSVTLPNLAFQMKKVKDAEKLMIAIVVEEVARNGIIRSEMHKYIEKTAKIHASIVKSARKDKAKELSKDQFDKLKKMYLYYDGHSWPISTIKSHIVLGINRGEEKGVLQVHLTCGPNIEEIFRRRCREQFPCVVERQENGGKSLEYQLLRKGLHSACAYLINASNKAVRRDLRKRAEKEAIEVFSANLRHLLLQRPLSKARILAMDPGLANGVKCVVLNEDGNILETFKCSVLDEGPMRRQVREMVENRQLNKIVIGNGSASQRTAHVVSQIIEEAKWENVEFAIVSETGASVYSASDAAKEELLDLDILYRGAVSIGRRVLDPLSELVKIPVKSMGIGMYQHDVNEKKLTKALGETVESCVASVGINAAVANKYVMEKVPGITKSIVHQIILARRASRLQNREDFRHVPSMTEGIYTQIVGFFRFPNSLEPLDNTVLLPEWYKYVRLLAVMYREMDEASEALESVVSFSPDDTKESKMPTMPLTTECLNSLKEGSVTSSFTLQKLGIRLSRESKERFHTIASRIGCGVECLRLIEKELLHPGFDPRSTLPHAGFMRTKLVDIKQLRRGDVLKGVVQSVTTFGAFVDCGLEQNVLVKGLGMERTYPGAFLENLIFNGLDLLGRVQVETTHLIESKGLFYSSTSALPTTEYNRTLTSSFEPTAFHSSVPTSPTQSKVMGKNLLVASSSSMKRPRNDGHNVGAITFASNPAAQNAHEKEKVKRIRKDTLRVPLTPKSFIKDDENEESTIEF